MFGQLRHGVGVQVDTGAGGYVVHDDGNVHAVGHGVVVSDQPCAAGPVVVGRHHQQRVRPQALGLDGLGDGPSGVVAARAHHQWRAVQAPGGGALDDGAALAVGDGGRFPGGAKHHDGVRAAVQLPVDQALQRVEVDAVPLEGRHQRRATAVEKVSVHVHASFP